MYYHDQILSLIAQARHEERLAEAEKHRLIRAFRENRRAGQPRSWQQLRERTGALLIALGHYLQAQNHCEESEDRPWATQPSFGKATGRRCP